MQYKKIIATLSLFLLAMTAAHSQKSLETDKLPVRSSAEHAVHSPSVAVLPSALPVVSDADAALASAGEQVVRTALQYLGVRYRSGHSSPSGFDCSGLTSYVFRQEGIKLHRSSRAQYTQGTPVNRKADLKKGDLVFFGGSRSSRSVGHVGIVVDVDPQNNNFKFVHASSSQGVKISDSSEAYYSRRYIGARRVLDTAGDN